MFNLGCVEQQWSRTPEVWGKPQQVTLCTHIPESQFYNAVVATEQWNKAIGTWKHINVVRANEYHIMCDYQMYEALEPHDGLETTIAWTDRVGGDTIYLVRGRYEFLAQGVMMHELGHILGAQHYHQTLMNPSRNETDYACPDHITVSQVAAWNHVNLSGLRWCK